MRIIDLSHTIKDGLVTYDGLPPVHVCDYLSRADSRGHYDTGTEFQIDQITMVGNSGTYIDSPFHRYADGKDLSELDLARTTHLPVAVARAPFEGDWMAVEAAAFEGLDIAGKAVLIDTGWSKYFGTEAYYSNHPYLSEEAAVLLRDSGAVLVGIDSHNIDDTRGGARPAHSTLLGSEIAVVEHLTNLTQVPDAGASFHAAPIKMKQVGTFPVRAFATIG